MPSSPVPVAIPHRPAAICPPTNMMNPDGFFIINMGTQIIQAHIVNQSSGTLANVRVYVEGISDPGVSLVPEVKWLGNVPAGASFPARFRASFTSASPGTQLISFIIESDGFVFKRVIKKIYVTRIDYDKASRTYSVVTPQGTMRINIHKAIMGPGDVLCRDRKAALYVPDRGPFIALPTDLTYDWFPNPPYSGTHGPLPYQDPWWKIGLAILAALALLGALLYDYFSDGTLDGGSVSVSGTFDETDPSISCCSSVTTSATRSDDWVARGLYSAAGGLASAAVASDGPDLHYRGQEKTSPASGEFTLHEPVHLTINYPVAPSPGRDYPIEGKWNYTRITTGKSYAYGTSDTRKNVHYLKAYEVQAPAIYDRAKGPLRICGRFQKPDGSYYKSNELYVSAVMVSEAGTNLRFELDDNGMGLDKEANDGWYCGGFRGYSGVYGMAAAVPETKLVPGDWYLFVFAQNVNTVLDGTPPTDAARTIGGFLLTPQLELSFNGLCTLNHDAVIHVV